MEWRCGVDMVAHMELEERALENVPRECVVATVREVVGGEMGWEEKGEMVRVWAVVVRGAVAKGEVALAMTTIAASTTNIRRGDSVHLCGTTNNSRR